VNLKRNGALLGALAVGALTLTACGTDDNSGSIDVDASASSATCEGKPNLSAAGSSAQKNAMDQFVATYIAVCSQKGTTVNVAYNPTGSGDGRTQFTARQIDFAGSDSAIKGEQAEQALERCAGNPAWNLPLVFGPVALAYNLDGVDGLVLDAATTAKIFNGSITTWNDPAIAALNEGVDLPDSAITRSCAPTRRAPRTTSSSTSRSRPTVHGPPARDPTSPVAPAKARRAPRASRRQ